MVSPAKTMIPAPATLTYSTEANASDPGSHKNGASAEDNERETTECLSGFIFLCNQTTKLQCYQYRVFGLPWGQKGAAEKIKPGSKLFLFDFKSKLLYGVYEATSDGGLNLEPAAFGGKFPAQVKFKIFKECLPIPESSLRYVIKENYTGAKFKQELDVKQVTKLISAFSPLAASICQPAPQPLVQPASISQPAPQPLAVSICQPAPQPRPGAIPPSLLEYQHKLTGRLPMMEAPYLAQVQYNNILPPVEARPVLNITYPEHGSHRREANVENVYPTLDHQSLPAASSYVAYPQQPLFAADVAHRLQEPSYSGYTTVEQRASHDEVTISGGQYHQLPLQRESPYQDNPASYYPNSTATDQNTPSVLPLLGRQYQDSSTPAAPLHYTSGYWQHGHESYFPISTEASLQGSVTAYNSNLVATAQCASSVMTRAPVPYDQSSLQGPQYQESVAAQGPQYQDSVAAYSSKPAVLTPYTTSVVQPQVQATYLSLQREALYQDNVVPYNSNPTVPAQYTSILQPRGSATNFPFQGEALR
ncbi:uncharacterized protein LOC131008583 [Salvia miltiorrhiza]|uniref:uncharacterized protein LOC131008583 n=1 Tax=Salvia miltiorrhiza TaxID=226208 RepID=UPI0025AB746C|nr:uncharacterized protein LOC131008583 [Salvia miltiorrhiza]